ncbi:MAG: hypothetical protein A2901_06835 [Elusimicrobia bacterium RIFCSPLOWO2_01_FULL_54_10]|nr:MAG: hypothetical protein A2901_06835 [Elusimicrobia bacterium RIFCSPLOWO2_01_FULL_54_10]
MADIPEEKIAAEIAREFKSAGGRAYLVGGCVRDKIMGQSPKDFDIEVYGVPAEKIEPVLRRFGHVNTMGKSFCIHRLIHPRLEGINFDVSIPRKDSKTGFGHKGFEIQGDPNLSVKEAARRRDITVNSILEDPLTGELEDPFGGLQDIKKKIIRATDAVLFGEDPLRVLRVCQFAARFEFAIDPETVRLCQSVAPTLKELSQERIGDEWKKLLLKSKKPSIGLEAVKSLGVSKVIHPELDALADCPQEPEWHPEGDVWIHTLMVADYAAGVVRRENLDEDAAWTTLLGALCHDFGKPATTHKDADGRIRSPFHSEKGTGPTASFLRTLRVNEDTEKKVRNIVLEHLNPLYLYKHRDEIKPATVKRLAVRLFPASFDELLYVAESDYFGRTLKLDPGFPAGDWLREQLKILELKSGGPAPILMGRHLLEAGWPSGPEMGKVLKTVFEMQIEGTVNDLEQAIREAEKMRK